MHNKTKKRNKLKDFSTYSLGDVKLQHGQVIKDAYIAYKTYGKMNKDKSNIILYPTWYSGFISDNEWLIGKTHALNPEKYFIIVVCFFCNGQSSSPSNNASMNPVDGPIKITLYDNALQQHRLITEHFQIEKLHLVIGWSMGAQMTYQWACLYPNMVERILPFCGSARTAHHNFVFLEGIKHALLSNDKDEKNQIRAFARVYAGWGFSQPFYKEELWRKIGFKSLEGFLTGFWENFFLKRDKRNLLAMIWSWQHGDISDNIIFKKNLPMALRSITAKTIVMPAEMDLYFPVADSQDEIKYLNNTSKLIVIPGIWGHFAGGGLNKTDTKFIDTILKNKLLN